MNIKNTDSRYVPVVKPVIPMVKPEEGKGMGGSLSPQVRSPKKATALRPININLSDKSNVKIEYPSEQIVIDVDWLGPRVEFPKEQIVIHDEEEKVKNPKKKRPFDEISIYRDDKTLKESKAKRTKRNESEEGEIAHAPIHMRRITTAFVIGFYDKLGIETKELSAEQEIISIAPKEFSELQDNCKFAIEAFFSEPDFSLYEVDAYEFQAKLSSKIGDFKCCLEIYKKMADLLKDARTKEEKVRLNQIKQKIFKYRLLTQGSLHPRKIEVGKKYKPTELLKMATYGGGPTSLKVIEKLGQHNSYLIYLLLGLNALEVLQNPDFKILTFEDEKELGFNLDGIGEFNEKNTIISKAEIMTVVHELMHKTLNRIFWGLEKPYENKRGEILEILAECINRLTQKIVSKNGNSVLADEVDAIKEYIEERGVSSYIKEMIHLYDLKKNKRYDKYLDLLKEIGNGLDDDEYPQAYQAEEVIVRYISLIAVNKQVEFVSMFEPLRKWIEKHIKPRMHEAFHNHPNKGYISII